MQVSSAKKNRKQKPKFKTKVVDSMIFWIQVSLDFQ